LLARRSHALSRARRQPSPSRLLHGRRRLRGISHDAAVDHPALAGQGRMDAPRDHQYRADGLVLGRSHDPRLRAGDLERRTRSARELESARSTLPGGDAMDKVTYATPLSRSTLAYVLAGGRGSRLMELTDTRAKPAVYFGGKSRIIDFALSNALN